jgi:hypothetical protein
MKLTIKELKQMLKWVGYNNPSTPKQYLRSNDGRSSPEIDS